jgi:hypothetical protein
LESNAHMAQEIEDQKQEVTAQQISGRRSPERSPDDELTLFILQTCRI